MATGIGEPPALSALHEGHPTTTQLLQSIVNLPVIDRPGREYFYNNTVYALGGKSQRSGRECPKAILLPPTPSRCTISSTGPWRWTARWLTDDPRGLVKNYSRGHGLDLDGRRTTVPYGAVGSYASVGERWQPSTTWPPMCVCNCAEGFQ